MRAFVVIMCIYFLLMLGWSTAAPMDFFLDYHTVDPVFHVIMWVYVPIGITILFGLGIATEWKIFLLIIECMVAILD